MRLSLKLLVLVLFAAVPVFAAQIYQELQESKQRRAEVGEQAVQLAYLAAARHDQFIEGARYLLTAAAQLREVRERDAEACNARMREFRQELPAITSIGVIDPAGNLFCTSLPPLKPLNPTKRDYVRRAIEQKSMTISGHVIGSGTGGANLGFAYPVMDGTGTVKAVIIMAFSLDHLSRSMAEMPRPPGATMGLLDRGGILLARTPPAPDQIGIRSTAAGPTDRDLMGWSPVERIGPDGVRRVYAAVPLDSAGELLISVGLPLEEALAASNHLFWESVVLMSIVFAAAAMLAWFGGEMGIHRPILELQRAAQQLAKGDLSVRPGAGQRGTAEIAALADSFDTMAQALQTREQALRDSEQRLRDIAESASDWFWETDAEHRFVWFSERLNELTGVDAALWLGKRRDEFLEKTVAPSRLAEHLADLAAHRPFRNFTYWFHAPTRDICASISGQPVFDAEGTFLGYRGTGTDVTEIRRADEQRARLATVVESSHEAIFTWTLDGTITSWNAEAERMYGYEAAEAIGRSIYILVPDEHVERVVSIIEQLRRGASVEQFDTVRVRKDGRRIDVSLTVSPIRDAAGDVVEASTIARDITQRKLAEAALRESEQRFKDVVEASSDSIWELDQQLRFTYVSDRHAELSGQSKDSYLGKSVEELLSGRVAPEKVAEHMADLRARRPFRNFIYWIEQPLGRRCYSVSGTPRFDAAGNFLGYRGLGSDITERQLAEERQALLMAELDHRVKNILATVQSVAVHSLPADGTAEGFSGRLAALAHAHSLLAQKRWEGAELGALVGEELAPYRVADEGQVSITGEPVLLVPKAAQLLTMAVHELSTNAAKYGALSTPEGRVSVTWRVAAASSGRRLQLTWEESGGPPVTPPARRGFGATLIERSLAYELEGEAKLAFLPEGLRCEIRIPLDRRNTA